MSTSDHNPPIQTPNAPSLLGDIQNPKLIWAKGALFLVLGMLSAAILVARMPGLTEIALLCICIWAFCRAYYFAFYVIQHYVDPTYKFAGLGSFAKYICKHRRPSDRDSRNDQSIK
ncbi:hypothetical protein Enr13x_60120 [Stieleria neptunia]|uniref:Uncharacterized protein n=1 Tax=Stieleria neptunia TaxID=2527979 RepID=A0A518HZ31_9BACT|nr:prolipoprotein diacylglyceryl transferase [Stieleria neptunia]QDV46108.1 hypothetical protein Enr13x_60120 [Stieleria neptunia]